MNFEQLMDCYNLSELENNRAVYNDLLEQIRNKNIIPFFGAGTSFWAYPLWGKALIDLAKPVGMEKEVDELLTANQYETAATRLEEEYGSPSFHQNVQKVFDPKKMALKEADRKSYTDLIPLLFTGPMITTNFDQCIEHIFTVNRIPQPEKLLPKDPYQNPLIEAAMFAGSSVLIKMHGDISDPDNIIFTEKSYAEVYGKAGSIETDKPMPKFLKKQLERRPLFFLGCSLEADRTCEVIKQCSKGHQHFALMKMPESTYDPADPYNPGFRKASGRMTEDFKKRRDYLINERNLKIIWYPNRLHDEAFTALFNQLAKDLGITDPRGSGVGGSEKNAFSSVDTLAETASEKKTRIKLCNTILQQDPPLKSTRNPVSRLNSAIEQSKITFPLLIKGSPGTGKSTLLSCLYLDLEISDRFFKWIIDLHKYDAMEESAAKKEFAAMGEKLTGIISNYPNVYLFVDGIDDLTRHGNALLGSLLELLKPIETSNLHIVLSVSTDENGTLCHLANLIPQSVLNTAQSVNLKAVESSSEVLPMMVKNILSHFNLLRSSRPKGTAGSEYDAKVDNFCTYCKKLAGNSITFRTIVFCAKQYAEHGDALFAIKTGHLLHEYFKKNMDNDSLSEYWCPKNVCGIGSEKVQSPCG